MHPPLHCPACQSELTSSDTVLTCPGCGERYPIHRGIPELISQRLLDDFKREEQHFHDELSESARSGNVRHRNSEFHWHFKRPMLELPRHSQVLEIACGTRADGIEIALSGKAVTSLDIALDAVEHSRRLAERNGAAESMRLIVADGEHLPFAAASFDATFIAASFHHFPDQAAALREMARVTRPGGYVILGVEPASWPYQTVYRLLAPVKRFVRRRRDRKHNSVADDSTEGYTEKQLRHMLHQAGLNPVSIRRVKFFSEFYDSGVRFLGRLTKRDLRSSTTIDHALARVDQCIGKIPGVDRAFWHYNVISIVPSHRP